MSLTVKQISSLEKVFLRSDTDFKEINSASCLKGEKYSYQLAVKAENNPEKSYWDVTVDISSPLKDFIRVYTVESVPVMLPCYEDHVRFGSDDDYLSKEPGLYPDLLKPYGDVCKISENKSHAIWLEVCVPENVKGGVYDISVTLTTATTPATPSMEVTKNLKLDVIDAILPKQKLKYTNWFHGDCLWTYYNVDHLSDRHFEIMENFIKTAAEYGMNTILTPIFTPPLDVAVGEERPTIQLVEISYADGRYSFDFKNLKRYIDISKSYGIEYFEMAHFFTQWGAKCTPKIIVNGEKKFGWHVEATDPLYEEFLSQFLPCLIDFLKEEGIKDNTYFHISDEPYSSSLENYCKAKAVFVKYSQDVKILDALSHYEFYEQKIVPLPVVSTNRIDNFLEQGANDIWAYYCCSQHVDVSNRFIAMPSSRNRVIGAQLFKYSIEGFLHWGYNFYYSEKSKWQINPFLVTDAASGFPAGDAFVVYPGADGNPLKSLRLLVFNEALQDIRAFEMASALVGKSEIDKLIDKYENVNFAHYPKGADYILELRESVNSIIKSHIK